MIDLVLAALFTALLFMIFKWFKRAGIPLLDAIVINYAVATAVGSLIHWKLMPNGFQPELLWVALVLGMTFVLVFNLIGWSSQVAGVAATTIASKMSLVVTVLISIILYDGRPEPLAIAGIVLAIAGVVAASWAPVGITGLLAVGLPVLLFVSNAFIDSSINHVQKKILFGPSLEVFPTAVFLVAMICGLCWMLIRDREVRLPQRSTWVGGVVLGIVNYASLYFLVRALSNSGLPGSSVFPLVNVGVVLFASVGAILVFKERPRPINYAGILLSAIAMLLIFLALS